MFTGKRIPMTPPGRPIGRRQQATLDLLEQVTRIEGARGAMQTPGGIFLQQPGTILRIGQTTSGGITARSGSTLGFGTVTDATMSFTASTAGTLNNGSTTFTAFNYAANPIGNTAAKYVVCAVLWGQWVVISAEC